MESDNVVEVVLREIVVFGWMDQLEEFRQVSSGDWNEVEMLFESVTSYQIQILGYVTHA